MPNYTIYRVATFTYTHTQYWNIAFVLRICGCRVNDSTDVICFAKRVYKSRTRKLFNEFRDMISIRFGARKIQIQFSEIVALFSPKEMKKWGTSKKILVVFP